MNRIIMKLKLMKVMLNKLKVSMYDSLLKMCNEDAKVINSSLKYSEDDAYFI